MAQSLDEAIAAGRILLTPTQRAARAIRRAYDLEQAARHAGQPGLWTPADVLPLDSWLAASWRQLLLDGRESRVLLNRTQQHALWRDVIAEADASASGGDRSLDALADLAARAWSLVHLYTTSSRPQNFGHSPDHRAFERWSRAFTRRLQSSALITAAELPAALTQATHHASQNLELFAASSRITLVDFETLPPALDPLLASAGRLHTTLQTTSAALHSAADEPSELQSAARWVLSRRQANPLARVAVVVPRLADRRAAIDRAFAPVLSPGALPITAAATPPVYEFSLGQPLAELPIASAALDLLTWTRRPLPLERISALLLSPWFGASEPAAAELDAFEIRRAKLLRPELSLTGAIQLIEQGRGRQLHGDLLARLLRLRSFTAPESQSFAAWADGFAALLDAVGWSRHALTASLFFQQYRSWQAALDELATLDFTGRLVDAATAQVALTRILRETIFAPESQDAPVQIIGPLEVGGGAFDFLWFLGADDLAWPAPTSPNPLLPWPLQRSLGIPGADRARDDLQAQALTRRIAHSAAEVVFSYARRDEEGERRPSPLLTALNLRLVEFPAPAAPEPLRLAERAEDSALPPLPSGPARGGSSILKLQAACPFRAFAEHRLFSTQPEPRQAGLDAGERGSIVHKVMELFWTAVPSQSALRSLPTQERLTILRQAIEQAVEKAQAGAETAWDNAYLEVQRRRLLELLTPWFDLELKRTPFHVLPPEEKQGLQLGPLELSLRMDRIDRVQATGRMEAVDATELEHQPRDPHEAAKYVILDYKTGIADTKSWSGERPDDPQLPVYAVLMQQQASQTGRELAGVAFAQLKAGEGLGLHGYAEPSRILGPGRPLRMPAPTLEDQVAQWRETLLDLAFSYAGGDTRVDPKTYPKTCQHCGQRILCRLDLSGVAEPVDDQIEDESFGDDGGEAAEAFHG